MTIGRGDLKKKKHSEKPQLRIFEDKQERK